MESAFNIKSISPLDSRYAEQTYGLSNYFSEFGLIRYRVLIEVEWLLKLSEINEISFVRRFSEAEIKLLHSWVKEFDERQALRVKEIEKVTRQDVKAVEYYLKERLKNTSLENIQEAVHFCCTSEDINNLAYALMLKDAIQREWVPPASRMVENVITIAASSRDIPLLTRTHGQPATPSTMGKELAVFIYRWKRQLNQLQHAEYLGKFNGAVGCYNAHSISYPEISWEEVSRSFIEKLGITFNPLTTQIEPHDYMAEIFHIIMRFHSITLDFVRDMWAYISLGYFDQKVIKTETGSSVMPHKVNPIDFENSEANLGISNALLDHLAQKLPVSRLQRDLSDSSSLRNIGTALGNSIVALKSAINGIERVKINESALRKDLENEWEVLAEAVQTVMRKAGYVNPYERMKDLTRGSVINQEKMIEFIKKLDLPLKDKTRLLSITPAAYTGYASNLVQHIL